MAKDTMSLDQLVAQLAAVHSGSLQAIVLYGSAASDEAVAGHSDQNVLVIVREIDVPTLRSLGQTARAWQDAGNPPPLTLTLSEWQRSSDIFPMEYADILERHRVLHGALPTDGITIDPAHLRLQVEQEAMGKLLRLRRAVMTAGTDSKRQAALLRDSIGTLLVIFRGVLRLVGERPPRDPVAVIRSVAQLAAFDGTAFERAAGMLRGTTISDGEIDVVMRDYVRAMDALVLYLDAYTPLSAA